MWRSHLINFGWASVGAFLALVGMVSVANGLSTTITPFSWAVYWSDTSNEWLRALLCLPLGVASTLVALRRLKNQARV